MFLFKSKEDALAKIEKLKENKTMLQVRIAELNDEVHRLEQKTGVGTSRFIDASIADINELENAYDVIELYERQIKNIDVMIEKINNYIAKKSRR